MIALRHGAWNEAEAALQSASSDFRCSAWVRDLDAAELAVSMGEEAANQMLAERERALKPCAGIYAELSLIDEHFQRDSSEAQLRPIHAETADPGVVAYTRGVVGAVAPQP
jgi:hypothetical protein